MRVSFLTWLFLAAFLKATTSLCADTGASITGKVTDPQGKGVPGTSVALFGRSGNGEQQTTADASGVYEFHNVGAGDYLIEPRPTDSRHIMSRNCTCSVGPIGNWIFGSQSRTCNSRWL